MFPNKPRISGTDHPNVLLYKDVSYIITRENNTFYFFCFVFLTTIILPGEEELNWPLSRVPPRGTNYLRHIQTRALKMYIKREREQPFLSSVPDSCPV